MKRIALIAGAVGLVLLLLPSQPLHAFGGAKPTITVGSKAFTEQLIVGNMVALLLESKGYPVNRKLGLGGTVLVHAALVKGDIDTYVEYTGTGLVTILKEPVITDPQAVYDKVKGLYAERYNLLWMKPWGFNNTYAIAVRKADADRLKIQKISDLKTQAGNMTLGATQEFLVRPDGVTGLTKRYGIAFKDMRGMDPGLVYQAIGTRQVDVISAFATDGRIPAMHLVVLDDDLRFFPPYYAAPVLRAEVVQKAPIIVETLNKLAGKISNETMAQLNYEVDGKKHTPEDVAADYLKSLHLITK